MLIFGCYFFSNFIYCTSFIDILVILFLQSVYIKKKINLLETACLLKVIKISKKKVHYSIYLVYNTRFSSKR